MDDVRSFWNLNRSSGLQLEQFVAGSPAENAAGPDREGQQQCLGQVAGARTKPAAATAAAKVAGEAGELQQGKAQAAHADCNKQGAKTGSKGQSTVADRPKHAASSRQGSASPSKPAGGKRSSAAAQQPARGHSKPTGASVGPEESLKRKTPAHPSNESQAAAAEQTGTTASGQQGGADMAAEQRRQVGSKTGVPGSSTEPIEPGSQGPRPSRSSQKKPRLDGPQQQQQARQPDSGGHASMVDAGAGVPAAEAAAAGRQDVSTAVGGAGVPPAAEAAAAGTGRHLKPALPGMHSQDQQGNMPEDIYRQTRPEQLSTEHIPLPAATGAHPQQSGAGRGGTADAAVRPVSVLASSSQAEKVVAGLQHAQSIKQVTEVNCTICLGFTQHGMATVLAASSKGGLSPVVSSLLLVQHGKHLPSSLLAPCTSSSSRQQRRARGGPLRSIIILVTFSYLDPVTPNYRESLQAMLQGTGMPIRVALHLHCINGSKSVGLIGVLKLCARCAGGWQGQCQEQEGHRWATETGPTLASAAAPSQGPSQGASQVSLSPLCQCTQ